MQGMMEFHGHTVVQPLGELSHPLEDYFTDPRLWTVSHYNTIVDGIIEIWFNLDEQGRKECIRRRGKERCFITGESSRTVHEMATRGANRSAALVPWNMELVSEYERSPIHRLLQEKTMKMVRFDPLDTRKLNASKDEGCLIVYHPNGRLMKEDELWMYQAPKRERAEQDLVQLKVHTMSMRGTNWIIARILKRLKDSGGYAEEGWDDIYMCAAQYGYPSSEVKTMIRAAKLAEDSDLDVSSVSVGVADKLRKVPEKDLTEVLLWFADFPPAEAWDRFNEKYPPKAGKRRFRIMKKQPYREVYAVSINELDKDGKPIVDHGLDDMVEVGGQVIVGIKEEVE